MPISTVSIASKEHSADGELLWADQYVGGECGGVIAALTRVARRSVRNQGVTHRRGRLEKFGAFSPYRAQSGANVLVARS